MSFLVLYNIPGRTAVNFKPESIKELLNRVDNIAAVKEASGDFNQVMEILKSKPEDFLVISLNTISVTKEF